MHTICWEYKEVMASKEDIPDLDVEEQLFAGVIHGSPDQYQGLLARLEDINIKNCSQRTLLHVAVRVGKYDWVERLLARGADPLIRDRRSLTVLAVAEEMEAKNPDDGSRKCILKLLQSVEGRRTADQCPSETSGVALCGESCTDPNTRIDVALKEEPLAVSLSSQDMSSFKVSIENLRQEILSIQNALSQDISSLRVVVEEQKASMEGAIEEVNVGLTSRDTLLEKLEGCVTSLAEEWGPLKEFMNERKVSVEEARGGLGGGSEWPLGIHPNIGVTNEEGARYHCIEAMMLKTEFHPRSDDNLAHVRSLYEKLYSTSPVISCVLSFLQFQSEVSVVIDCGSASIGRIKSHFTDLSGNQCEGRYYITFAEFKGRAVYLGGKVDDNRSVEMVIGLFAMSLAQISMLLAFKNKGRPFVVGDEEHSSKYKTAMEEAMETWSADGGIEYNISAAVKSESELHREVGMISVVPAMIAYFGSTNGTLRARRKMRLVLGFYEDHVMPTLRMVRPSLEMNNQNLCALIERC